MRPSSSLGCGTKMNNSYDENMSQCHQYGLCIEEWFKHGRFSVPCLICPKKKVLDSAIDPSYDRQELVEQHLK